MKQLITLTNREYPETRPVNTDPETLQEGWYLARTVTGNDTALAANTRTWSTAQSKFLALPRKWNTVSLSVVGYGDGNGAGDPASGSFTWTLYGIRQYGGPEYVGTGTWAIGAMEVSHNPASGIAVGTDTTFTVADQTNYKWGELPVLSNQYWPSTVDVSGTTDHLGTINFDPQGCWGVYLEITNMASVTTVYVMTTGR